MRRERSITSRWIGLEQRVAERVDDRTGDEHGRHVDDRHRRGDRPADHDPGPIDDRVGRSPQRAVHLPFEIGRRHQRREASGASAPARRPPGLDDRVGERAGIALGPAQPAAGDDARRLDRDVDDEREELSTSPCRRRATVHPRRGRSPRCRARPAGRSGPRDDSRSGNAVQAGIRCGETEPAVRSNGVVRLTPTATGAATSSGRRGEHAPDELLEHPPHLAARRADAVADEHLAVGVDDARRQPDRIDDHRQDGGTGGTRWQRRYRRSRASTEHGLRSGGDHRDLRRRFDRRPPAPPRRKPSWRAGRSASCSTPSPPTSPPSSTARSTRSNWP